MMFHDALDRAFLTRLALCEARTAPVPQPAEPERPSAQATILESLLQAAADAWGTCADAVEAARDRLGGLREDGSEDLGLRLAVIAGRPEEGCTTTVEGLAATLRGRGYAVETLTIDPPADAPTTTGVAGGRQFPVRQLTILDAGAWFGRGPIRRERTAALRDACDAAILLRRSGRPPATACAAALAAVGIDVLGEVVTFAGPPAPSAEGVA